MTEIERWNRASQAADAAFEEARAFIDRALPTALEQLPELEKRDHGGEILHRYPEKSVDVMLGLRLVQLSGNIRAGELLIDNGLFLEWEIIQRSMQDALEDITFLVAPEFRSMKSFQRFKEFFFDEDVDPDGSLTGRRAVTVARPDIIKVLAETQRQIGGSSAGEAIDKQLRRSHRIRSGSVHGRGASIIRAYYDESASRGLWLGGARDRTRTAWERPSLYFATAWTVSATGVAGHRRWWDRDVAGEATRLADRLRKAAEDVSRALKGGQGRLA